MNHDSRNSVSGSLLGSNNGVTDQDSLPMITDKDLLTTTNDAFSRQTLALIKALREALDGKGNDYVRLEMTRLLRELTLITNLITLQIGGKLCLELL